MSQVFSGPRFITDRQTFMKQIDSKLENRQIDNKLEKERQIEATQKMVRQIEKKLENTAYFETGIKLTCLKKLYS